MRRMRKWLAVGFAFCMLLGAHAAAIAEAWQSLEPVRYARVVTDKGTLNMRSEAKDSAKVLTRLARETIVYIVEDSGDWTKILHNGRAGYVKSSFLEEIYEFPYSLITKESDGDAVIAFKRTLHKLGYLKSDDINKRFDAAMENALTKVQLMNNVALSPQAVTPELQALMEWGMLAKGKSGYIDTATDQDSGLTVAIFCWDSGGILYEADRSVKVEVTFAVQATGGQPPVAVTVKKSLSGGGEAFADVVTSPFSQIWSQSTESLYLYAVAVDSAGNMVTACTPFRYTLPARYANP